MGYRYRLVLETDSAEYGGHRRLDPNCEYSVDSQPWHERPFSLLVSLFLGGNFDVARLNYALSPGPFRHFLCTNRLENIAESNLCSVRLFLSRRSTSLAVPL